jgi:crotonyl-CoA reductase
MKLKTIKGSHFSNYREAWAANQTIIDGTVVPPLSAVFPLEETAEAAYQVQHNRHEGKIGILCLAPREGLGVTDTATRQRIGENRLRVFRRHDEEK